MTVGVLRRVIERVRKGRVAQSLREWKRKDSLHELFLLSPRRTIALLENFLSSSFLFFSCSRIGPKFRVQYWSSSRHSQYSAAFLLTKNRTF